MGTMSCVHALLQLEFYCMYTAYLRYVGTTSLNSIYRIFFDVGNGDNPKALKWLQAPPTPCPPIMP